MRKRISSVIEIPKQRRHVWTDKERIRETTLDLTFLFLFQSVYFFQYNIDHKQILLVTQGSTMTRIFLFLQIACCLIIQVWSRHDVRVGGVAPCFVSTNTPNRRIKTDYRPITISSYKTTSSSLAAAEPKNDDLEKGKWKDPVGGIMFPPGLTFFVALFLPFSDHPPVLLGTAFAYLMGYNYWIRKNKMY